MELCSMKHESCIKFYRVAHLKTVFNETLEFHETQFSIEHVLFDTTCSMKLFPIYQRLTDMWPMKIQGKESLTCVFVCKHYSVEVWWEQMLKNQGKIKNGQQMRWIH